MRHTPRPAHTDLLKPLKCHLSRWKILLTLETTHPSLGLNCPRCCGRLPDLFTTNACLKKWDPAISRLPQDTVKEHMELKIKARILHPPVRLLRFLQQQRQERLMRQVEPLTYKLRRGNVSRVEGEEFRDLLEIESLGNNDNFRQNHSFKTRGENYWSFRFTSAES